MIRPDLFCFLYDECIDTFLPKRTYTLPVYIAVNEECTKLSQKLKGWTPARVARALWVAARENSLGLSAGDHTIAEAMESAQENIVAYKPSRSRKRRR
eukprot:scaffold575_cov104-Cylindrotheca_fusiformis.AAC.7